jgi:hypothetical protein
MKNILLIVGISTLLYSVNLTAASVQAEAALNVGVAVNKKQYKLAARLYLIAGEPVKGSAYAKWNTVPDKDNLIEEARKALGGGGALPVIVQEHLSKKENDKALAALVSTSEAVAKINKDKAKEVYAAIVAALK